MNRKVHWKVIMEAGEGEPDISRFLRRDSSQAYFETDVSSIDTTMPGIYKVKIKIGSRTFTSKLIIQDTIPPLADTVDLTIPLGEIVNADAFVTNIEDATKVKVSFLEEPDFTLIGDQSVTLVLEDLGNNKNELEAKLTIAVVHDKVSVNIGAPMPGIEEFMMSRDLQGSLVTDISVINMDYPGEHDIIINFNGKEYISRLIIIDNVPPTADIVSQEIWLGEEIEAEKLVTNIQDHTSVEVSYRDEPDFNKEGEQIVFVVLEDTSGNRTELGVPLMVIRDTEPPVIKVEDTRTVYIGENVSYKKGVTVTDNRDENPELAIDSSAVNLKKPGTYQVIYTATDSAGNSATKTVDYIVKEKPANYVNQEEVEGLADQVLATIITEDMTPREQARAIYDWTKGHIYYTSDYKNHTYWVRGAYDGIKDGRGDCYAFFATAKMLLTRAGIENMDVVKVNGRHFWSLINLGEGWYHFDTTPRRRGGEFFMLTDAELHSYSVNNGNSHIWDRDKYPKTPSN
ncbi:MAG: DUF5011 domain-containing protein [Clostridiales bacterium]|nr:DUF5011 domain-containing protein [Clostridiales bacterium]